MPSWMALSLQLQTALDYAPEWAMQCGFLHHGVLSVVVCDRRHLPVDRRPVSASVAKSAEFAWMLLELEAQCDMEHLPPLAKLDIMKGAVSSLSVCAVVVSVQATVQRPTDTHRPEPRHRGFKPKQVDEQLRRAWAPIFAERPARTDVVAEILGCFHSGRPHCLPRRPVWPARRGAHVDSCG